MGAKGIKVVVVQSSKKVGWQNEAAVLRLATALVMGVSSDGARRVSPPTQKKCVKILLMGGAPRN